MFTGAAIGLALSAALVAALALLAALAGATAALGWDPDDASARQLWRERRMLLVQSAIGAVLGVQLVVFFLFLRTADRIHALLPGAMCAAGALAASRFGYPLLALHVTGFVLAATWLLVNRETRTSVERRVVRAKAAALLAVAGVLSAEAVLQVAYFADLHPSILASCCGTIFDPGGQGFAPALARLPAPALRAAFLAGLAVAIALGGWTVARSGSPVWFALAALLLGVVAVASLVAWIGPDVYGVASHHCPFCVLAPAHHHVGYFLYAALAAGLVTALASGALRLLRARAPRGAGDGAERRLCRASLVSWVLFAVLAWAPALGALVSS